MREAARERWRRFSDALSQLEHLHGGAIATAMSTGLLDYLALPRLMSLGLGLAAGIAYRQIRFAFEGGARRQCLAKAAAAATHLLDDELFSGKLSDVARMSQVSIRTLARAVRQDRLSDVLLWTGGGVDTLSRLIQSYVNEFERATSHCAGRLWPPRGNALVARVIADGSVAVDAAASYESQERDVLGGELRYDEAGRRHAMREVRTPLGDALMAVADAAEQLEEIHDPAGALAEAARRDANDAAAAAARRELQAIAAAGAEELLTSAAPAPEDLERSTLRRADPTLRDIAEAEAFQLASADEEATLFRWTGRILAAPQAAAPALAGRGLDMHHRTNFLWVQIRNDCIRELEQAVEALRADVHAQCNAGGQFTEEIARNVQTRRDELREAARRFVKRVDELRKLEVR